MIKTASSVISWYWDDTEWPQKWLLSAESVFLLQGHYHVCSVCWCQRPGHRGQLAGWCNTPAQVIRSGSTILCLKKTIFNTQLAHNSLRSELAAAGCFVLGLPSLALSRCRWGDWDDPNGHKVWAGGSEHETWPRASPHRNDPCGNRLGVPPCLQLLLPSLPCQSSRLKSRFFVIQFLWWENLAAPSLWNPAWGRF